MGQVRYDLGSGRRRNMMKNNQFWFEFSCLKVKDLLTLDISLSYIILQSYITWLPKSGQISFFLIGDPDTAANIVPRASLLEKWEGWEPWRRGKNRPILYVLWIVILHVPYSLELSHPCSLFSFSHTSP